MDRMNGEKMNRHLEVKRTLTTLYLMSCLTGEWIIQKPLLLGLTMFPMCFSTIKIEVHRTRREETRGSIDDNRFKSGSVEDRLNNIIEEETKVMGERTVGKVT